ncbi:MAG: galactokinase, partial [Alphaproteobacteria bacterium]|nr:galactokinase [Alphaproteobacteria bacterium]
MTAPAAVPPLADGAAEAAFRTAFGRAPAAVGEGHARANLLGEHTDYNDGFVLPTPLAYRTL